jgi:hypothetical protein
MWPLLADGHRRFDVDDVPPSWGNPADESLPELTLNESREAVGPVAEFVAHGSEVGEPCDNPFCCG